MKIFGFNIKRYAFFCFMLLALSFLSSCEQRRLGNEKHVANALTYTCPMHPQVISDKPGSCPVCGMDLVVVTSGGGQQQEIMLSETQRRLANIHTRQVQLEEMGSSTFVNGKLVVDKERTEVISSRVSGRIEKLYLKEIGEKVSKGTPLYEIYSEQLLTLQEEYLLALRQAREFRNNDRYAAFLNASEKKLLLFGMTKSQIEQLADLQKTSPLTSFHAPISGVVAEIAVAEGQYLDEGGLLYRIENLDKIWIEADLYPNESKLAKEGQQIKAAVSGFEDEPVTGKVTFLSPEFRKGSQIITLRAEIENLQGKFQPGMQASLIITNSNKKSLTLPVDAVIRDEKGSHVWVEQEEGVFVPRVIDTGLENFEKVEILAGLEENEKVVVSGAYLLYSEFVLKKGGNPMAGPLHSTKAAHIDLGNDKIESPSPTDRSVHSKKPVSNEFKEQLRKVLNEYYKIKDALVKSDADEASKAALSTQQVVAKTEMHLLKGKDHEIWMKDMEVINKGLTEISNSKELEKQRTAFNEVSVALHNSLKEFEVQNPTVFYQYCPMALNNKGGYWLSNVKEITNPFFGKQMLGCGETKEVLPGK